MHITDSNAHRINFYFSIMKFCKITITIENRYLWSCELYPFCKIKSQKYYYNCNFSSAWLYLYHFAVFCLHYIMFSKLYIRSSLCHFKIFFFLRSQICIAVLILPRVAISIATNSFSWFIYARTHTFFQWKKWNIDWKLCMIIDIEKFRWIRTPTSFSLGIVKVQSIQ